MVRIFAPHPMSLPTRTRSDTRNSLSDQLGHPVGWSFIFPIHPISLRISRQTSEQGTLERPPRRAGDGAASPTRAASVAHGNRGSRRSFRQCPTALSCTLPARVVAGHRPASRVCRPSVRARVSNWTFCRIFPRRLDATPDFSVIFMWQAFCIDRLRRVYQTYSAKR